MFSGLGITDRAEQRVSEEKWLPACFGPGRDRTSTKGGENEGQRKNERDSKMQVTVCKKIEERERDSHKMRKREGKSEQDEKQNTFSWHCQGGCCRDARFLATGRSCLR